MSKPVRQDHLAMGPFLLIETPANAQQHTQPYDQYIEAASIMALGHNVIIRGLNSIYKQAPHIAAEDAVDFIEYASCWFEVLDAHHNMEENSLFPQIEATTRESHIMDVNIEQHHAFQDGLSAYKVYLNVSAVHPTSFSGTHLRSSLIDGFAPALVIHLSDEISTLISLSRFGTGLALLEMINLESQKSLLYLSLTGGTPFCFRNLDSEFEGGRWMAWPPMPRLVWWLMQNTLVAWNQRWWRFASCDERGRLREIPYFEG